MEQGEINHKRSSLRIYPLILFLRMMGMGFKSSPHSFFLRMGDKVKYL